MKTSKQLRRARGLPPHFPQRGVDGYAGEQDGDRAVISDIYTARSLAEADETVTIPPWARVHWAEYHPGVGWEFVLGAWRSKIPDGEDWP